MKKYIIKRWLCVTLLLFCMLHTRAEEVGDSIDSYQDHIVSNIVSLQGHATLDIQNVTVSQTGFLKATAPENIVVTGPFEVQLGGKLELNGGRQWMILYTYDNSGNRIIRKRKF